ncbi:hypothetical protein IMZ48_49535 [Candidatus Bathyarchaeota archaeon]|nr:hypothetical protein [Candidatus Bathyarchaeota archaeon]
MFSVRYRFARDCSSSSASSSQTGWVDWGRDDPPKCQWRVGVWVGRPFRRAWDMFLDSHLLSPKTNSTGPTWDALKTC